MYDFNQRYPDMPIAYLWKADGEPGYRAICPACMEDSDNDPRRGSPLYISNIRPYKQSCCLCGKVILEGGSVRDLFDGT